MRKSHTDNTVGPWAAQKLDALQRYLETYMVVMKKQSFTLVYIDAFAGAGVSKVRSGATDDPLPTFLDEEDATAQEQFIEGSPLRALSLARPFDHYRFVDMDPLRALRLEGLKSQFPSHESRIKVINREANEAVQEIASKFTSSNLRGVAFLDPYGAHLHWRTLEALGRTKKFDVIINFPLDMAINRLIKRDGNIPPTWVEQLDSCFGGDHWRDAAYERMEGFFGAEQAKRADCAQRLLTLYCDQLKQTFGHVSRPSLVRNTKGTGLYYLIWASGNHRGLGIANHILRMGETPRAGRKRVTR